MSQIKKITKKMLWLAAAVILLAGCAGAGRSTKTMETGNAREQSIEASGLEPDMSENTETASPEAEGTGKTEDTGETDAPEIDEKGVYDTKEDVALYLHIYGHLPDNYITKKEAEKLGWRSKEGNLWDVAPEMSIGGSRFGNYEKQLPEKEGRKYYECDLEYDGGYRGAKRLIYSDDGLIFYTEDHYKTFEQLYDGNEQ